MNGVAMARHGLIHGEDGATWSRKVSGYLWCLPDTMFILKIPTIQAIPKKEIKLSKMSHSGLEGNVTSRIVSHFELIRDYITARAFPQN